MKILVVASEAVPFIKTGGLGDVIGALPRAFTKLGNDVKVFIPRYQTMNTALYPVSKLPWNSEITISNKKHSLTVECINSKKNQPEIYFVSNDFYFNRPELYRDLKTGKDYDDNDERFIFFNRAVLETIKYLDWKPDIIHIHDWQAGLIPAYLKFLYNDDSFYKNIKTVLTIHNLAYQGTFPEDKYKSIGLPEKLYYPTSPFEFYNQVNFLKAAITYSDKITTVSERYAEEIQTKEHGCGLDGVLLSRKKDIKGILNGVDYSIWSPSRDKKITYNYFIANLSGKRENKVELTRKAGLPFRDKAPLIGIISRLADQKGFDLIAEIADKLFELEIQMIVLGTGEKKYHELFTELEQKYPDKIKAYLTFDDTLAHQIEAASDIFLMPSYFEPCGLNQMYSLKYGTVPIVREVGGLADTVVDFDEKNITGTGFVFSEYKPDALFDTIERAVNMFAKKRLWTKIVKAGMKLDYSWEKSAHKYQKLFEQIL